jgi:hypothetical protein
VVTGQTQQAGKTTCLESLITRSGLRAITFITKRGEGSFAGARRIDPYFREQADWQFVAAILEASRGEKLKFERAWIIRASKGARTLADVQRNVQRAMGSAKGMSADVYLTLDAYLEVVVPEIARVRWAPGLALEPGVNAMDLTALSAELQHLVIKSSLDWVLAKERDTVVVMPEAWKFAPEGHGTPVKRSAEAFIRQAAGLRNYLWLDSQDIAGVWKLLLKSVPLWILGVQREANEVKRTLAQIPAGIGRPRSEDIATLELGQFYACWGRHVLKVYVQPAWMADAKAQAIARGERPAADVPLAPDRPASSTKGLGRAELDDPVHRSAFRAALIHDQQEDTVTKSEALALQRENEELKRRLAALEHPPVTPPAAAATPTGAAARERAVTPAETVVNEALYQEFKRRLVSDAASDPVLLRVLAERPELRVEVERRTVEANGSILLGRLARLLADGFFDTPRTGSAAYSELRRLAFPCAKPNVYREADKLATFGFLTKEGDGYRAVPGMTVNIIER